MLFQRTVRTRTSVTCTEEEKNFGGAYQPRSNLVKHENGDLQELLLSVIERE
jgi:hypothetical protein